MLRLLKSLIIEILPPAKVEVIPLEDAPFVISEPLSSWF